MSRRRWSRWLGPPLALVAVALVLGRFQPGAEAGGRVTPRPAGVCAKAAPSLRGLHGVRGAWWRLVDRIDASGTLVGRTLVAGQGGSSNLTLELGSESSATGPVGGLVVVSTDDGVFSDVRIVSAVEGCSWLIHRTQDVVRSAILNPSDGALIAHVVSRETRDDAGTWRISGMDPDVRLDRLLAPLPAQPGIGLVWSTNLHLDRNGKHLAVQSCAEAACLTRIVSLADPGAEPVQIDSADQGEVVGFTGDRLITWAHCQGLPCAVRAWTAGSAKPETLADLAAGASLTGDQRYLVVVLDDTGRAARIDLAGRTSQRIKGIAAGDLPIPVGTGAYLGFEVAPDEVAIAAVGSDARPFSPSRAALVP